MLGVVLKPCVGTLFIPSPVQMCHVAAWVVDGEWAAPHGTAFWRWADAFMAHEEKQWRAARYDGALEISIPR